MDRTIPKIIPPSNSPFNPWLWRMAWRDSRRSRRRLLLFMSAIVLGIAALVAINSFSDNLSRSINEQAKELVGADLVLSTGRTPTDATRKFLDGIGQRRTYEAAFPSMVFFPGTGRARLAQVKALRGDFPYFGRWETTPAAAANQFRKASRTTGRVALVDEALLAQFGAKAGDSVKVGNLTYFIIGSVQKTPGQTAIATAVAPTVFIPAPTLPATGLLQRGSRVNYSYYYRFAPGVDVDKYAATLGSRLDKEGIRSDTVAERKNNTGRAFTDMTKFLNLVAFVALLLGCVGVASAVHLYVKEKIASVAVLRCLGATGRQAFYIFLIQTALMGLAGAVAGAALGSAIQFALPQAVRGVPARGRIAATLPDGHCPGHRHGAGHCRAVCAAAPAGDPPHFAPAHPAHLLRRRRDGPRPVAVARVRAGGAVHRRLFVLANPRLETGGGLYGRPAGGLRHTHRPGLPAHVPRAEVLPGVVELRVAAEPG
jgi:putative ABC transport system permease protein